MIRAALFLLASLATMAAQAAFDPSYAAWDAILKRHVRYAPDGFSSRVDYAGLLKERPALRAVLAEFSAVPREDFERWPKAHREAFLINAYNAFTLEKVLTRYPNLRSIRDFGSVFGNPWKDRFFTLLGERRTLDEVEHGMLRLEGAYDEPRVHVALVCASIGCPMLRDEAFVAARLDAQLDDALRRFLSDRARNRYDPASGKLLVSRIFDWYGADFARGHHGFTSVKATLARYADVLADAPADREAVRAQRAEVGFLDYDWGLNDAK